MFIISVTAYADFDIPYEVNVVALKNKEDADKLTMILNTFCAELKKIMSILIRIFLKCKM